ncbi:type II toxin-antitoxin system RelE/ParE family toxin [Chryseobacterium terrae]|uniref:Type II toxin-antitoxin system RelE/ParE family toxin n=1 Tax=Chryseobacterium terrae TaxID=3163299 RepID=A0ABW8Y602_9FLAO
MRYEISEKAEQDLLDIEKYLLAKWNVTVLENFFIKLQKAINLLLEKKVLFKKYENTHFHQYVVTKHNSLIYFYEDDVLYIVRIIQNFQNPDENYQSLNE